MGLHNNIPATRGTLIGGYKYQDRDTAVDSAIENTTLVTKLRSGTLSALPPPVARPVKPRQFQEARVCSTNGCDKVLSKYNKGPQCYAHQPMRVPRIRGRN